MSCLGESLVKAAGRSSHLCLSAREGRGGGGWSKQYLHLTFQCKGGASGDCGQSECMTLN